MRLSGTEEPRLSIPVNSHTLTALKLVGCEGFWDGSTKIFKTLSLFCHDFIIILVAGGVWERITFCLLCTSFSFSSYTKIMSQDQQQEIHWREAKTACITPGAKHSSVVGNNTKVVINSNNLRMSKTHRVTLLWLKNIPTMTEKVQIALSMRAGDGSSSRMAPYRPSMTRLGSTRFCPVLCRFPFYFVGWARGASSQVPELVAKLMCLPPQAVGLVL